MNKNSSIRFLVVLPVLAFFAFVIIVADLGVLAQNTNTSTTNGEGTMQDANANANAGGTRRRGRRGQRGATRSGGDANMAVDPSETPAGATRGITQETDTGVSSPGEATDLSGTYEGRVRMTGGHEMSGTGTLTITGNSFTLSTEGMTHSGRIIAVTTRGYTGATLWFTDQTDSATNTPLAAAVRVRRGRNNITMTPVPGARNRLWFTPGGGRRGGGGGDTNTNTGTTP